MMARMKNSLSFLGLVLLLPGCVSQALLASQHSEVKDLLGRAQTLSQCSPKDRALAEANLAFAELEMKEADARRAAQHMQIAIDHARIVANCAPVVVAPPPVKPKPEPEPQLPIVVKPGDIDHDGVVDTEDQCPRDMEDLDGFKDSDGCPDLDDDTDGVVDTADLCPREAEDKDGYNDADGCPETDNDGDLIPDNQDRCPNESGDAAHNGCPVYDRDSDGIKDDKDACVDQPEVINAYLDEDGCPDVKPTNVEITADQIVIKQRINFATGKATILSSSFPVLDDVAQVLRDYPNIKIEIGGHTDNVGDDALNQRLSKARADSVFEYLVEHGIAAARMTTMGYGEVRPIDTNRTDEGRQNNRRVEFTILSGGPAGVAPGSMIVPNAPTGIVPPPGMTPAPVITPAPPPPPPSPWN